MTDIAALIAKLEAAPEGSWELDWEIQRTIFWFDQDPLPTYIPNIGVISVCIPAFTTSIDGALTLVPEGWFLDLHDWTWAEEPCWNANLQRVHPIHTSAGSKGATAALAVTIAALKAKFANTDSKEEA